MSSKCERGKIQRGGKVFAEACMTLFEKGDIYYDIRAGDSLIRICHKCFTAFPFFGVLEVTGNYGGSSREHRIEKRKEPKRGDKSRGEKVGLLQTVNESISEHE